MDAINDNKCGILMCDDILLNRIFYELKQADVIRFYADLLIEKHITRGNRYNILVMLVSGVGAVLAVASPIITIVASSLVAISSIINQCAPIIFLKTNDLTNLTKLASDYKVYLNILQDLYSDFNFRHIEYKKAITRFNEIIEANASKSIEISRIFGKIDKELNKKAINMSTNYLNEVYNGENKQNTEI